MGTREGKEKPKMDKAEDKEKEASKSSKDLAHSIKGASKSGVSAKNTSSKTGEWTSKKPDASKKDGTASLVPSLPTPMNVTEAGGGWDETSVKPTMTPTKVPTKVPTKPKSLMGALAPQRKAKDAGSSDSSDMSDKKKYVPSPDDLLFAAPRPPASPAAPPMSLVMLAATAATDLAPTPGKDSARGSVFAAEDPEKQGEEEWWKSIFEEEPFYYMEDLVPQQLEKVMGGRPARMQWSMTWDVSSWGIYRFDLFLARSALVLGFVLTTLLAVLTIDTLVFKPHHQQLVHEMAAKMLSTGLMSGCHASGPASALAKGNVNESSFLKCRSPIQNITGIMKPKYHKIYPFDERPPFPMNILGRWRLPPFTSCNSQPCLELKYAVPYAGDASHVSRAHRLEERCGGLGSGRAKGCVDDWGWGHVRGMRDSCELLLARLFAAFHHNGALDGADSCHSLAQKVWAGDDQLTCRSLFDPTLKLSIVVAPRYNFTQHKEAHIDVTGGFIYVTYRAGGTKPKAKDTQNASPGIFPYPNLALFLMLAGFLTKTHLC